MSSDDMMSTGGAFSNTQVEQLLKPIHPSRVQNRKQAGRTFSYLSQHDVRAHMIRVFGFGNFDVKLLDTTILDCEKNEKGLWDISAMATVEVAVRDPEGQQVCTYSDAAVGTSSQPRKGEAYDMAIKTAASDAFKRCCINLGDQFGLSLYNDGSTKPFVIATMVMPDEWVENTEAMQVGNDQANEPRGQAEPGLRASA